MMWMFMMFANHSCVIWKPENILTCVVLHSQLLQLCDFAYSMHDGSAVGEIKTRFKWWIQIISMFLNFKVKLNCVIYISHWSEVATQVLRFCKLGFISSFTYAPSYGAWGCHDQISIRFFTLPCTFHKQEYFRKYWAHAAFLRRNR